MTGKGTTTTMTAANTSSTSSNSDSSSSSSSLSQISSTNGGIGTEQTNNKSLKNHQKKPANVRLPAISLLSHTSSSSSSQPHLSKTSRNHHHHHHNSKTVIDITNLYKQSPTILFVKEKYKVYLDWLARNYAAHESPNHHSHHLAWYDFEKSLDKTGTHPHPTYNVNTHFQQFRPHHYHPNGQQNQTLESLDSSVAAHNQRLLANVLSTLRNNREFGCEDRRLDLDSIRRCQPIMVVFLN